MVKFCVTYQGRPADPQVFDRYYWEHHLPIVARWPRIRGITVSRCRQLNEPVYQIAELCFDNISDLEGALASPERKEAALDRSNFPDFYGTVSHQIFEVRDFPLSGKD